MKAFLLSILVLLNLTSSAQQEYFVFINTDDQQPFYVQLEDKTYSSSSAGHLILSKLKDSAYQITVGFPKSQFPEMDFMIRISRKDHGYQLKNLADKGGWVLFDLQSMELIKPLPKKNSLAQTGYNLVKKDDDFARMMARVVSDTAVLYAIVQQAKKEEPAVVKTEEKEREEKKEVPVVVKPEEKKEPVVAKTEEKKPEEKKEDPKVNTEEKKPGLSLKTVPEEPKPKITLLEHHQTDSGYAMVVADENNKIDIFIPSEVQSYANPDSTIKKPANEEVVMKEEPKKDNTIQADTTSVAIVRDEAVKQPTTSDISNTTDTANTTSTTSAKKLVLLNSDCHAFAADGDVDKLRIKMLAEDEVDDKIAVARKVFKTKCFTAAQVKGLTELFRNDEGIYKFLDAAYPFVSDTSNFKSLVSLLSDDYYVKRFKTMVRMD